MSDVEKRIEQWREDLAGSELLGWSDVAELESHLRDQMEHLMATGLSDKEAFFIARARLGDAAALEEEFAKVSPHRRFAGQLSWMAAGVLAYLLLSKLSECATFASTQIGYAVGLRHPYLAVLACAIQVLVFVGVGAFVWRSRVPDSPPQATTRRARITARATLSGLFAACWAVALWWIASLYHAVLARTMSVQNLGQLVRAQMWASFISAMLVPFLAAGLIVWVAYRRTRVQQRK